MDHEVTANRTIDAFSVVSKASRYASLAVVWAAFLGSNYLTITHLISWLKTDRWPNYSTANLFTDLRIHDPGFITLGGPALIGRILTAPAAYTLMGLALILSITVALLPDD